MVDAKPAALFIGILAAVVLLSLPLGLSPAETQQPHDAGGYDERTWYEIV